MQSLTKEQALLLDIVYNIPRPDRFIFKENDGQEMDWDVLIKLSIRHKMYPIVYKFINPYIPARFREKYDREINNHINKTNLCIAELEKINNLAQKSKIKIVLIKGMALAKILYDNPYKRQVSDIDILVNEDDMDRMHDLLTSIGYFPDYGYHEENDKNNLSLKPVYKFRYNFHEIVYLKPIEDNKFIKVEVKRATSAIPQEQIAEFLVNTQKVDIGDFSMITLDDDYTLLHLFANTYHNFEHVWWQGEGFVTLRDYLDVYMFISKYGKIIDWNRIHKLSNKHEMLHCVYCVLNNLGNKMYDGILPDNVIELFNLQHATYKLTHLGLTSTGSYIDWESAFVYRIFNDQEREDEFQRLLRKKFYSDNNINYKNAQLIQEDGCVDYENIEDYIKIDNIKYNNYDLRYLPLYDEVNLYLLFYMDHAFYNNMMEKSMLVFTIFNNMINEPGIQRVSMIKNHDQLFCLYDNTNEKREVETVLSLKAGRIVKVSIPYGYLLVDLDKSKNKICYFIKLAEIVFGNDSQCIGGKYFYSNLPGVIEIPSVPLA